MKKLFYIIGFLLLSHFSIAQSFEFVHPEASISGNATDLVYIKLHVKNLSAINQNIIAKRKIVSLSTGQQSYFCFGIGCYPPSVSISPELVLLAPGAEDSSLKTYINPKGNLGTSVVEYCLVNENNTDSLCITLTYNLNATGIFYNTNKLFVSAFPNPANEQVTLLYNSELTYAKTELQITDITGKVIERISVENKDGYINVPTSTYANGVYICQLVADGLSIANAKILVQR